MILSLDPKRQRYYVVLSERAKSQHSLMCKLDNLPLRPNSMHAEVCKHRELAYSWKAQ